MSSSTSTSRTARAAIALKSGVVMGGTAILSAVNGLTPHMAGAIDIMVVQQPDGSLKCSPFYVRFGKYTPMRSKDKKVHILINGEEAAFQMHLGAYGQAYFAAETMEIVSDADDDEILQGMMSPPSGYSSDEDAPYANEEILSAVQQEVQRLKDAEHEQQGMASPRTAAAAAATPANDHKALHQFISGDAEAAGNGDHRDEGASSSSSSSGLDDLPDAQEIAAAVQQGWDAGLSKPPEVQNGLPGSSLHTANHGSNGVIMHRSSSSSSVSSSNRRPRRHMQHRGPIVLDSPGDGAAADPARSRLQDLLLDNRYSLKVKSDESFTADGLGEKAAAARHLQGKSHLHPQLQQQIEHESAMNRQQVQQDAEQLQPQQETQPQQQQAPIRHVGFQVAADNQQQQSSDAAQCLHEQQTPGVLESSASCSISVEPESSAQAVINVSEGADASTTSLQGPSEEQQTAAVVSQAVAAVIAANQDEQVIAAATTAANDISPTAVAASQAVSAANAAVKAQALAAVQQSSQQVTAADIHDDQEQLLAMPTLTNGLAMPGESSQNNNQQQQDQQQQQLTSRSRQGLLASSLREAEQQQQQVATPQIELPAEQQPQEAAATARSSSSNRSSVEAALEPDAVALLDHMEADNASAALNSSPDLQQGSEPQDRSLPSPAAAAAVAGVVATTDQEPSTPGRSAQSAAVPGATSAATSSPAPVSTPTPAAAAAAASLPVTVPGTLAASPPVDSGYLGDTEQDKTLGTSYDGGVTPRSAAIAADHLAAGSGPLALGLAGFQLSMCGGELRAGMSAGEAQQVFEAQRVSGQLWSERGVSLMEDQNLVVKIGGNLYSWQVAAPMVVGMLAFGGKWDNLLGLDPTGTYPIKVAEDHSSTAKKASSSWRLWPFTGWRDNSIGSKSVPGTSPATAAAGGSATKTALSAVDKAASAGGLAPSGGSFGNLLNLMGPGAKSAPALAGPEAASPTADDAGAAVAAGGIEGSSPSKAAAGSLSLLSTASSPSRPISRKKHIIIIRKTLTPTSEQLSMLPLKPGANTITFRASGAADLTAYIYLLRWNTRLVVSDVDGTITRSDLLGHVLPTLGVDWSHPGITQLFHNIDRNGYQIMFLSSRAIAQANITREYLHSLVQDGHKMPSGPVIISPHGLLPSLYREIVVRRPHEFKIACLQDIRALFPPEWNPFYGGFGNRDTDEVSYKMVGVPVSRTFTINPRGQIQKASTALQSSTWSRLSAINELVDEIFPPLPAAYRNSSSKVLRLQQISYTSSTDWELAAAVGLVTQETLAAAIEERRRSSIGVGFESADGLQPVVNSSNSKEADEQVQESTDSAAAANGKPTAAATNIVADGTAAAAAGTATAAVYAASYASSISSKAVGPDVVFEFGVEDVGPAREEFADLQYWKTSVTFTVDIEEELRQLEKSTMQQQQQQQLQQQQAVRKV